MRLVAADKMSIGDACLKNERLCNPHKARLSVMCERKERLNSTSGKLVQRARVTQSDWYKEVWQYSLSGTKGKGYTVSLIQRGRVTQSVWCKEEGLHSLNS